MGGASLGSARGEILIDVAQAMSSISSLQGALGSVSKSTQGAFGNVAAAGTVLAGFGAAVVGGFGLAIKGAADFEQQMSAVQAVTGASGATFDALREKALQLGKDTSFSASEAASAIEELGKAGVSTEDILNGAADGATALAAASGTGLADAATIMSNALNIFNLEGTEATHVADVFAAAANTSAADVQGLAAGIAQAGAVAASFGISLEETVGSLALFADNGLKGSDAGTSFKTMLLSMLDPTQKQAGLMNDLGLSFFDAQGQFIGLDGVAGQLQDKLKGLTEEQRNTALAVLFGSDAVRAANILYKEGADGVQKYVDGVNDAGAAGDAAAKRLDNFKGSIEQLKGSLETLGIIVGSVFLPALRDIVDAVTKMVNVFIGLPGPVQAIAAVFGAAAGGISLLAGAFLLLLPRINQTVQAFQALRPALAALAVPVGPILAVVAALAALGVAYKLNLFGFADAVNSVASSVASAFAKIQAAAGPIAQVIGALFGTKFANGGKLTTQLQSINGAVTSLTKIFGLNFQQMQQVRVSLLQMAKPLRQLRNSFRDVTQGGIGFLKAITGNASRKDLLDFHKRLDRLFGKDIGEKAALATRDLRRALKGLGESMADAFGFDASNLLSLPGIMEFVSKAVTGLAGFLRNDLIPAVGPLFVAAVRGAAIAIGFLGDHMDTIASVVKTVGGLIGETLAAPFRILAALLNGDVAGAFGIVTNLISNMLAAGAQLGNWVLTIGVPTIAGWVADHAGDAWEAIKDLAGFVFDQGEIAAGWLLNVGAPTAAGWLAQQAGNLSNWIRQQLTSGWDAVVDLGPVLLNGAVDLGGELLSTAGNLAGFIGPRLRSGWNNAIEVGNVLLNGAISLGGELLAAAGAMSATLGPKLLSGWDRVIDLGRVLVTATLDLAGDIDFASAADAIKRGIVAAVNGLGDLGTAIASSVKSKISGIRWDITGEDVFNAGVAVGAAIRQAIETAADLPTQIGTAIGNAISRGVSAVSTANVDWASLSGKIVSGMTGALSTIGSSAATVSAAIGTFLAGAIVGVVFPDASFASLRAKVLTGIQTALTAITVPLPSWQLTIPDPIIGGIFGAVGLGLNVAVMIAKAIGIPSVPLPSWHLDLPSPEISGYGAADLEGDVNAFLDGIGDIAPSLAGWILSLPSPEIAGLSKEIVISKILEALVAMGDIDVPFPGGIHIDFPNINPLSVRIPVDPTLELAGGVDINGQVQSFITGFSNVGDGTQQGTSIDVTIPVNPDVELAPGADIQGKLTGLFGSGGAVGAPTIPPLTPKIPVNPTVELAAGVDINTLINDMLGGGGDVAAQSVTITATFNADTGAATSAIENVRSLGEAWNAATFTGHLLGDPSGAFDATSAAMDAGGSWDGTTWTGQFNGDPSGALAAAGAAQAAGNAWAGQVFTARFSVDTSGITAAVGVAQAAAAAIAAVMPHSPAKEGPLKKPIKFDYIADNMKVAMDRMTTYANMGAAAVAQSLTGSPNAALAAQLRAQPHRTRAVGTSIVNHNYALTAPDLTYVMERAEMAPLGRDAYNYIRKNGRP